MNSRFNRMTRQEQESPIQPQLVVASEADEENKRMEIPDIDAAIRNIGDYPRRYSGRGIVMPGGGEKYFPCAWVCINMLRRHGCELPIELWHLGPHEMSQQMRQLVEPLGVRCVDAHVVRNQYPARRLGGWELKPYSVLHSRFEEVLLLDADNVPTVDPTFLFNAPQYEQHGVIFWPDYSRLGIEREIWRLVGVEYRDEPEFESGQILINKEKCWRPLKLAMWFNEQSDFWYRYIHGDKETFHMAWRKLRQSYAMVPFSIHGLPGVMCQHDFDGNRIFQHRNLAKFSIYGTNPRIHGFQFEQECLEYIEALRNIQLGDSWNQFNRMTATEAERCAAADLCCSHWQYIRVGYDQRRMTFELDGRINTGADRLERLWTVREAPSGEVQVTIQGCDGPICHLIKENKHQWSGYWLLHERMPIILSHIDRIPEAVVDAQRNSSIDSVEEGRV